VKRHLVNVDIPALMQLRHSGRSPGMLRTLVVGIPCVPMSDAKLPTDRRATAQELRAWQKLREDTTVTLEGTWFAPGGDA